MKWINENIGGLLFFAGILTIIVSMNILLALQQERLKNQQEKLNFLCSPGVYIETVSNNNIDYAICKMTPTSEELIGKKISK